MEIHIKQSKFVLLHKETNQISRKDCHNEFDFAQSAFQKKFSASNSHLMIFQHT